MQKNIYHIRFEILNDKFDDFITYLLILGIIVRGKIGVRIIFYNFDPITLITQLDIFKIWQGGMSFHGGLVGVYSCKLYCFQKKTIKIHFDYLDHCLFGCADWNIFWKISKFYKF